MVNLRVGEIVRFILAHLEGIGILLGRVEKAVWPTWRLMIVAKDGSLGSTIEVDENCLTDAILEERNLVLRHQRVFIEALQREEYRTSSANRQITVSKKKSKATKARWERIEKEKANGTFVPRKGSKHKKPDQKGKSQKKGKKK